MNSDYAFSAFSSLVTATTAFSDVYCCSQIFVIYLLDFIVSYSRLHFCIPCTLIFSSSRSAALLDRSIAATRFLHEFGQDNVVCYWSVAEVRARHTHTNPHFQALKHQTEFVAKMAATSRMSSKLKRQNAIEEVLTVRIESVQSWLALWSEDNMETKCKWTEACQQNVILCPCKQQSQNTLI